MIVAGRSRWSRAGLSELHCRRVPVRPRGRLPVLCAGLKQCPPSRGPERRTTRLSRGAFPGPFLPEAQSDQVGPPKSRAARAMAACHSHKWALPDGRMEHQERTRVPRFLAGGPVCVGPSEKGAVVKNSVAANWSLFKMFIRWMWLVELPHLSLC